MPTPVTPVEITPGTAGSWVDVDVSSYVDAGNTAGVFLEVVCPAAYTWSVGVRKNGSTDDFYYDIVENCHAYFYVGVDSNDILEIKVENVSTYPPDVYLIAYVKNSEGSFFTNGIDKSLASTSSWIDIDISSDTGTDTAKVAFWEIIAGTYYSAWLRQNGSTDGFYCGEAYGSGCHNGAAMGVDANEVAEGYIKSTGMDFYLMGYLTDNVSTWANAKDYSTATTGSYVDVDFSSDISSGNNGAFYILEDSDQIYYKGSVRKNGSARDVYETPLWGLIYGWTEIDSDRVAEQKIETSDVDLWLWGYTNTETGGGGGPAGVKTINDVAIASVKTINDVAIADVKTINDAS